MKIRTVKPEAGNKYFIRKSSGGYSTCIQGKPTDANCNVLANCVGYACGAFNEEHEYGYEKYHLNCNAENFIERAVASGLSVYKEPVVGGIMVWQKGATLSASDGAGHVAICTQEIVKGSTEVEDYVVTSDSAYGGKSFLRIKRKRGSSGNWGSGTGYKFRGCIAPEGYTPTPKPEPKPEPQPEPTPTPAPTPSNELKVGDKVKIIATGNGSSYGTSNKAYGLGWTRYITKIYEGRPFPYQVGNKGKTDSANTTGFYSKSALQKID